MVFSPKGVRTMPKLNRPPKYCKLNNYAVVYFNGKPRYLGQYGSPESKVAYSRFVAELLPAERGKARRRLRACRRIS